MLTTGAYFAVTAVTNDDGASPPQRLTVISADAPPWAPDGHWGVANTPAPAVALVGTLEPVASPVPTPVPAPPPTEVPTEVPVVPVEEPAERAPAAEQPPVYEPPPPPPPPPPAGNWRYDIAGGIASGFNSVRSQYGLGGVSQNGALTAAAESYVEYHYLNYGPYNLSHTYDGVPADRASRAGYTWSSVGEVIAYGASSAQGFIDMWLNSGGHRDIILDGNYVDVGVACYESAGQPVLCVAVFGRPG